MPARARGRWARWLAYSAKSCPSNCRFGMLFLGSRAGDVHSIARDETRRDSLKHLEPRYFTFTVFFWKSRTCGFRCSNLETCYSKSTTSVYKIGSSQNNGTAVGMIRPEQVPAKGNGTIFPTRIPPHGKFRLDYHNIPQIVPLETLTIASRVDFTRKIRPRDGYLPIRNRHLVGTSNAEAMCLGIMGMHA